MKNPPRRNPLPLLARYSALEDRTYVCPGEAHPISHSIHLARQASFYSKCRSCAQRTSADHSLGEPSERRAGAEHQRVSGTIVVAEGVRGIYLNAWDRTRAAQWAAALASMLWDEEPRQGISSVLPVESGDNGHSRRRGPTVVIGFDERPWSPDIVTGVAQGLRRMGCRVIDLGQTTEPITQFTVHHLNAAAGVFVTGAGHGPAWTGFDVVGRSGQPWPVRGRLEELEQRTNSHVMRPTRSAGTQRTFQALALYLEGLWKHFHALRPLRIVCGSSTKLFPRILDQIFSKLPCRVTHVAMPVRQRHVFEEGDVDIQSIGAAVVSLGQHLGFIVDDDGQRCAFVTEQGRLVMPGEVARILIEAERRAQADSKVVIGKSLADELSPWLIQRGVVAVEVDNTASEIVAGLIESGARLGLLHDGRVWFGDSPPFCDAIITCARILQSLSFSDAPFGQIVANTSGP